MELTSSFEGTIATCLVRLTKSLPGLEDHSSYFEGHSDDLRGENLLRAVGNISGLNQQILLSFRGLKVD